MLQMLYLMQLWLTNFLDNQCILYQYVKKRQPVQIWLSFYFDYVIRFDNKKSPEFQDFLEATTRFELVIRVLQTRALPLGYVAI